MIFKAPAPLPLGWKWFEAEVLADGILYGMSIPAASWEDADAALGEIYPQGKIIGTLEGTAEA